MKVGPTSGALEVNLGQGAGQQLAGAVVHIDLHQQSAAGGIDGVGGAHQRALIGLAGVLGKGEVDLHAALEGLRIELRHVGVNAQRLEGLHVEELRSGALPGALADELAGIDRARRHHAVEGRVNLLERLQFAQPLQVGLSGLDG